MRYFFIADEDNDLQGVMYELIGRNKKKKIGDINLESDNCKLEHVIAVCCQQVAEGDTIQDICNSVWSPTLLEFYSYIDKNIEWKGWYDTATKLRTLTIVDDTIKKIKEAKVDDVKTVETLVKLLEKLSESDGGIKSITHVSGAWQSKAQEDRKWRLNED